MAFHLASPAEAEASVIADIYLDAMKDNLLLHAQFPTPESRLYVRQLLIEDAVEHIRDDDKGVLVTRDDDSRQILSFVQWRKYHSKGQEEIPTLAELEHWPKGCRAEYYQPYSALTARTRGNVVGDEPYYHVAYLSTKTGFSGKGAASRLVRQIQERAAKDGTAVVLESTMEAVGFYEKLGFKAAQSLDLMIPAPGANEPTERYEEQCMVWTPPPSLNS